MDNLESQEMELLALQSILENKDFIVHDMNPPSGRFVAHVRLPENFFISYKVARIQGQELDSEDNEVLIEKRIQVEYLPPFTLFFEFPETYPQQSCPAFMLSCNWLTSSQLTDLCRHLESLWLSNNDSVLYTWFQFLAEEALGFLKITDCLDVTDLLRFKRKDIYGDCGTLDGKEENVNNTGAMGFSKLSLENNSHQQLFNVKPSVSGGTGIFDVRALNQLPDGKILISQLKNYNEFKKEDTFKSTSHICDICFLTKEGYDFITFKPCKHSFCNECIKSYFEVQIEEGNVGSLYCPDGKCESQADGSLVQQVVRKDLYEKYDRLLLSRTLEDMSDVTFCPRKACQCPVLLDVGGQMGTCLACNFVFCAFCNMVYHGVAPCIFKAEERLNLYEQYTNGTPSVREKIEKQYGKRMIKALVEEILSESWKSSNSKNCPHCKASIEKTEGCNKMTCFKCGTYFCWLCNAQLRPANPYDHFKGYSQCILFNEDEINNYDFEPGEFLPF